MTKLKMYEQDCVYFSFLLHPWHSSVVHGAEFTSFSLLLLYPQKSISLQLSHSISAGFGTFALLYHYFGGHRPCNLLWEVALYIFLVVPQSSCGPVPVTTNQQQHEKRLQEVWTSQTNAGCLIWIAGLNNSIVKSLLLSLVVKKHCFSL